MVLFELVLMLTNHSCQMAIAASEAGQKWTRAEMKQQQQEEEEEEEEETGE